MKKITKKVILGFSKTFVNAIAVFRKNYVENIMSCMCISVESETLYAAYQVMPKNTAEIPILDGLNQINSFAIILQGPICKKDNMTLNTVLFYKKVYPYAVIIVSTWNDESEKELEKIAKSGAIIVKSEKPLNSGCMNVNYQLTNSLAGVKKAGELGCKYAVKTRTDQRVCKPYIFDAMLSALKLFPGGRHQEGRLITLGYCGGGMFIPFHTCDFLYFGYTKDLLRLFSAPLDERLDDENIRKGIRVLTRRQLSETMLPPEIYILKHYCNDVLEYCCEDTVASYWHVVKNYLICFGMKDVDLMWNKYNRLYDLNYYSSMYGGKEDSPERLQTMCFDFFNWLNIYTGKIEYNKCYERYADVTLYTK